MNPYFVLGVAIDADDAAIRRAYLEAVKRSPPDLDPERFQCVNTAYEKIKNAESRHRHVLFDKTTPGDSPLDVFARHVGFRHQPQPLPFDMMKELLRECAET
ncbi:MAG: J domain-containing protein [Gemmatimonadaceae bacterium]